MRDAQDTSWISHGNLIHAVWSGLIRAWREIPAGDRDENTGLRP
jgi:hypothetical protein